MIRIIMALALAISCGGCARLDRSAISYLPYDKSDQEEKPQRLFVWRSNYSAGVSTKGGVCVQAATTARTTSLEADAAVNTALLKALVPALAAGGDNEQAIKASAALRESVMLTNATTAQTAMANIAYFMICQISLNKNLTPRQTMSMFNEVTKILPLIGASPVKTSSIDSPEIRNRGVEEGGVEDGGVEDGGVERP